MGITLANKLFYQFEFIGVLIMSKNERMPGWLQIVRNIKGLFFGKVRRMHFLLWFIPPSENDSCQRSISLSFHLSSSHGENLSLFYTVQTALT